MPPGSPRMMNPVAGVEGSPRVLLITDTLVIALAVFFVLFALGVVWAALWYNTRQEKQVRTDKDDGDEGEDEEDFMLRPGEQEEEDENGWEPGTERFRRI